jgi:hypothetical protein
MQRPNRTDFTYSAGKTQLQGFPAGSIGFSVGDEKLGVGNRFGVGSMLGVACGSMLESSFLNISATFFSLSP